MDPMGLNVGTGNAETIIRKVHGTCSKDIKHLRKQVFAQYIVLEGRLFVQQQIINQVLPAVSESVTLCGERKKGNLLLEEFRDLALTEVVEN